MNGTFQVNPLKLFKVGQENCVLTPYTGSLAVGNNQQVVAAVSGKRIRVMGYQFQSVTAVGKVDLKDGSAGTIKHSVYPPANTAGDYIQLPVNEAGYFETSTGVGLYADITTATVLLNLFYIIYTPQ